MRLARPTGIVERAGSINGGREAANKSAFVAAAQTRVDGRPLYLRQAPMADFTNEDMRQWAQFHPAPRCAAVRDGTPAFAHLRQADATHERHVTGGGRREARMPQLHWVNTLLRNLKASLAGTYRSFDHARHRARDLAGFCDRFHRRFDLPAMLLRLLRALATTRPIPLKMLRWSEVSSQSGQFARQPATIHREQLLF